MDFDVLTDFEDCASVQEPKDAPLCNCTPKKKTGVYTVPKKNKNFGKRFWRCPDWNNEKTCNFFAWV